MRREWIEIVLDFKIKLLFDLSPSMRREWIEILKGHGEKSIMLVSLHAEGVD